MASSNQGGKQGASQGGSQGQDQQGSQSAGSNRGFGSMDEERQREIASKGGKAAHESGSAHEFTSQEAREAGRKSHSGDDDRGRSGGSSSGSSGGSAGGQGGNRGGSSAGGNSGGQGGRR